MRNNGFYVYRSNIYYGCYEEEQVSGRWKISGIKPERILTGHPVGEEDWAVRHILPTDMVPAPGGAGMYYESMLQIRYHM